MIYRFFSLRIVATIVACLVILYVHGQYLPAPFFGSWEVPNNEAEAITTIVLNEFKDYSFYGGTTTYRWVEFHEIRNSDPATKDRFPAGIKFELILISGDVNPATIGKTFFRYIFMGDDDLDQAVFGWDNHNGGITVSKEIYQRIITEPTKKKEEEPKVKEPKVIKREFKGVGHHSYVYYEGVPATVEVSVIGAGGGAQGGHTKDYQQGVGKRTERGVGGGGGGGAFVAAKFEIPGSTTFNITVGEGGAGGAGKSKPVGGSWESGSPGKDGGNSSISYGKSTITAMGGKGGGASGAQNVTGGQGGQAGPVPQGLLDISIFNGINGGNGRHNSTEGGQSGRSVPNGTQGDGGASSVGNKAGANGNSGQVIIIITYH